jgi:hypothetical protein
MNAVIDEREMDEQEAEKAFEEEAGQELPEDGKNLMEKIGYQVRLSREYDFNGKKISEIDLSGMENLTTVDAQEVDRSMAKAGHHPRVKYGDTLFSKLVAMRATGLPEDFFNLLRWKDMDEITSRVSAYFLFG